MSLKRHIFHYPSVIFYLDRSAMFISQQLEKCKNKTFFFWFTLVISQHQTSSTPLVCSLSLSSCSPALPPSWVSSCCWFRIPVRGRTGVTSVFEFGGASGFQGKDPPALSWCHISQSCPAGISSSATYHPHCSPPSTQLHSSLMICHKHGKNPQEWEPKFLWVAER